MTRQHTRWLAAGGVLGPASFIVAWSVLGSRTVGYSPVDNPISRLAAIGAETRAPMTAGLIGLGVGMGTYAGALAATLPGPVVCAAATTAAASFSLAALPLGSAGGGSAHAVAAAVAYASLAAVPLTAAKPLRAQGRVAAGRASIVIGALCAAALLASVTSDAKTGLLQRVGLTTGHVWIVASAVGMLRRNGRPR